MGMGGGGGLRFWNSRRRRRRGMGLPVRRGPEAGLARVVSFFLGVAVKRGLVGWDIFGLLGTETCLGAAGGRGMFKDTLPWHRISRISRLHHAIPSRDPDMQGSSTRVRPAAEEPAASGVCAVETRKKKDRRHLITSSSSSILAGITVCDGKPEEKSDPRRRMCVSAAV